MLDNSNLITKLNRSRGGSYLPDLKDETKALTAQIEANRYRAARALAGVGTFSDTEQKNLLPMVPGANEAASTALAKNAENIKGAVSAGMTHIDGLRDMCHRSICWAT